MSHLDRTSISSGAAAELPAVHKTTKYPDMLHDYHFVPVAVETLGPWCDAAMNFITQLGRRMTVVTGEQYCWRLHICCRDCLWRYSTATPLVLRTALYDIIVMYILV